MRKWLFIFLCLPLFIFSQEERKYERTMSISQFAKDLKEAAERGDNYTLEDCEITYNPINDRKYVIDNLNLDEFEGDALIQDLQFSDGSLVSITNCKFGSIKNLPEGYTTTLQFINCSFGSLYFKNINVGRITIDNISAENAKFHYNDKKLDNPYNIDITESKITDLETTSYIKSEQTGTFSLFNQPILYISKSNIQNTTVSGFSHFVFKANSANALLIGGIYTVNHEMGSVSIKNNIFSGDINMDLVMVFTENVWRVDNYNGIFIKGTEMKSCHIYNNKIAPIKKVNTETFNSLKWKLLNATVFGSINLRHKYKDTLELSQQKYNFNWSLDKKIDFIKKYYDNNDVSISTDPSRIDISNCVIDKLYMKSDTATHILIENNEFKHSIYAENIVSDSIISCIGNTLPSKVMVDNNFFVNFGFVNFIADSFGRGIERCFYGKEEYSNIKKHCEDSKKIYADLIQSYKQFIKVLKNNGNALTNNLVIKLKDIQANIKKHEYYEAPSIEKWFNWRGAVFLKWYSDYGTNPFKALTYCFWAMLYFAMFYFIFYNEWDKIDRGFLIKKFNSVMDYFTTEKRIEDFYATTHNKEMTTFTEFKDTLDKNKVYMPTILASLAKPIYQISLLRYKLLNFSYKKAEFMAGRKWVDLEQKEKYWIGSLTFCLTLTYIVYLIFIRALNSIVLSINAFSTLGFGQIPVRGFTKYVAIIEGFIGWFLLSIFLVSVLSQMMSV